MKTYYFKMTNWLSGQKSIPILAIRLLLAYGFYGPAMMKIKNVNAIAEWFTFMEFPAPMLNAYLITYTEFLGFILLFLGLGTRFISFALMIAMVVAIKTVHLNNGFEASDNGFEIPLYYLVMLLVLFFQGSGNFSLDYLINRKIQGKN